jgi:hypothetical protein
MRFDTKKEAQEHAARWHATMPPGWEVKVWENMGWHWRMQMFPFNVYPVSEDLFSVLVTNNRESPGTGAYWTSRDSPRARTPMKAVSNAAIANLELATELAESFELTAVLLLNWIVDQRGKTDVENNAR